VEEALQLRLYQDALAGNRAAQRAIVAVHYAPSWTEYEEASCAIERLRRHRPQSSSASRFTAAQAGFFILSQSDDLPLL
jgi:hypothetical protein